MMRIIATLCVLLAFVQEIPAQSAPPTELRLKELVAVSSEVVRIGDLVERAGAAAGIAVFRAPDLGHTGSVPVARVAEALRQHGIDRIDADGLYEVVVTRLSRPITGDEIKGRIARAFAGQFGFGDADNLAVILDREVRVLHVEAVATGDFVITRMNAEPRTGRFEVAFELPGSAAARRLPLRFTGTVTELVQTATLARSVKAGEIIKASDVVLGRKPKLEVGAETFADTEQAIGLAAKSALRVGQSLRPSDLIKAQVVQRNEAVTIVYSAPGVALTVRGKAAEAGALGDTINVVNVQSNRTIQGTIIGPGRVSIAAAIPQIASVETPDEAASSTQ
jgi:flagellar basal body P-ring formation protein FlgA